MSLPMPPPTHPATTTGHIPHDSIGPLPPHLSDIGSPERQNSIAYTSPLANAASPSYSQPVQHASPTSYSQPVQHASPTSYSQPMQHASPAYTSSVPPVQGKTYEQEVNEFLDQTSPARIREQSPTTLPPESYMAKANEESVTGANSPARARAGSPYQTTSVHASPTQYSQPVHASPTSYSQPVQHASPTSYSQPMQHASPAYTSSVPPVQGKTYEQEVNEFLDQTSPARIREQSPTTLPPESYMAKANEESVTGANSPARARAGSPYQPVSTSYQTHVSTVSQPAAVSYQPAPVTTYQHASPQQGYVSNGYTPSTVAGSPGRADLGSVAPPGPGVPGEGESPRRLRAFGHPHSDPNAPNQSPQRGY